MEKNIQNKGYVHLYYGFGKGKTSIINGMVLRAMGVGMKVKYYRFMKNWPTGELEMFKKIGLEVEDFYHSGTKFFWEMNEKEKEKVKLEVQEGVKQLLKDVKYSDYDLILVDELFSALDDKLISKEDIINIIKNKNSHLEIAFSAHKVDDDMFKYFDLASEVVKKKHYYDTIKLLARKGIEF